ncbi:DUF6701 domain-containing protein [Noviherbaspirillum sedimenti]|nr:DUF6701 domain-containing protein [Noviherbaspirillum sedimenti]
MKNMTRLHQSIKGVLFCWVVLMLLHVQSVQAAISFKAASSAAARTASISYSAMGSAVSAASGNVTVSLSGLVSSGDLLICQVESRDNVAHSMPAGWTMRYSLAGTPTHRASLFYKISGASEPNPLITHPGGSTIIARCLSFRGVDLGDPFDGSYAEKYAGASTTVGTGSMTTTFANTYLLFAAHLAGNMTLNTPSGWTRRIYSNSSLAMGTRIALYHKSQATAATVGPFTTTVSLPVESHGVLMALQPASTLTINVPAGTAAGDVMIAAVATVPSSVPIAGPAGWTLIQSQQQTSSNSSIVSTYYRVAGASEPASYSWTLSSSQAGAVAGILTYSGVVNVNPVDVSAVATTASSKDHVAPSITPTQAGAMLVTVHEFASASSWAAPAGMTRRVEILSRKANKDGVSMVMNDLLLGVPGATGTKTATASQNADRGATVSIALRAASSAPHHIQIEHDGAGVTCAPETVTVKACADAACNTLYTGGGVTGTLFPNGSGFAIGASGSTTGTVNPSAAGTDNLNATGLSPAPLGSPAVSCLNRVTGSASCSMVFSKAGLTLSLPNFPAATGTASATIKATDDSCSTASFKNKTVAVNFYSSYTNPSSGTAQVSINNTAISKSSASPTAISLNFDKNGIATFSVNYPDVGRVTLDATATDAGSTHGVGGFVAYPAGFTLSAIKRSSDNLENPAAANAAGAKFVQAGDNFSVTVTAKNALGDATPNFGKETSPESVKLSAALIVDPALTNNPGVNGAFDAFSDGVATGTAFTWNEVGIIKLTPRLASGNYLSTGVDIVGTVSGNIGRFYPHHFDVTLDPDPNARILNRADIACDGCTFTYMGERMDAQFALSAKAKNGDITQNYAGAYVKLNPAASGNPLRFGAVDTVAPSYLNGRLDTSVAASGSFSYGSADIVAPLTMTRAVRDGPYAALHIGVAPVDGDGVAMGAFDIDTDGVTGKDHASIGSTQMRYGRLRIGTAHGSELLALPLPVKVQYWNGMTFITNEDDSETVPVMTLDNYQRNLNSGETVPTAPTIVNGAGLMILSKPGANNQGSVDVGATSPTYLPANTGRATFGVYKGGAAIYMREMY